MIARVSLRTWAVRIRFEFYGVILGGDHSRRTHKSCTQHQTVRTALSPLRCAGNETDGMAWHGNCDVMRACEKVQAMTLTADFELLRGRESHFVIL